MTDRRRISRSDAVERSLHVHLPPFEALVEEHRRGVWRYLVAAVGAHDAGDCFQETMLSALRAYSDLRDDANLGGWLFTIAHRKVIDASRARSRRAVPVAAVPEHAVDARSEDAAADGDVWSAVAALTPTLRSAVVLRFVADRPYRDIAAALDVSEATARQRVHAALQKLREDYAR
jgi:RNA polymerase sigma factor (sigma-70 family)